MYTYRPRTSDRYQKNVLLLSLLLLAPRTGDDHMYRRPARSTAVSYVCFRMRSVMTSRKQSIKCRAANLSISRLRPCCAGLFDRLAQSFVFVTSHQTEHREIFVKQQQYCRHQCSAVRGASKSTFFWYRSDGRDR